MKSKILLNLMLATCLVLLSALPLFAGGAQSVPRMAIDQLKVLIGDENVVIVDVRSASDWNESDTKIKGAFRVDPHTVTQAMPLLAADKTYVFYCA